jgi:hypothetical protein
MTCDQTFDADVFVERGPVDAVATSDQTPVTPLGWVPVKQARVPGQRYDERASVFEINAEVIRADLDIDRSGLVRFTGW